MRETFRAVWRTWGPHLVTRPLLVSGHASTGADVMAERLWRAQSFDVVEMPANWQQHGRRAGHLRNQQMVDHVLELARGGAQVVCTAFLDPCAKPGCRRDGGASHWSHGAAGCREAALRAGLRVVDVVG